jgi:hypothetical protein
MAGQTLDAGAAVVVVATGERGVVLRTTSGEMVDVALPGSVRLIHADDLRLSEPKPGQLLLQGRFGDPSSYSLRLQSLYPQHAYRFDPLTGLSNARIERDQVSGHCRRRCAVPGGGPNLLSLPGAAPNLSGGPCRPP